MYIFIKIYSQQDKQSLTLCVIPTYKLPFVLVFLQNKQAFVGTAKEVIANCQSVTQFVRVIANHCLDKQCTAELSLIVEQILTITNQLSIISR